MNKPFDNCFITADPNEQIAKGWAGEGVVMCAPAT